MSPTTDIVSPIKVFELHDIGAPADIFQSIYSPSLVSMHYRCPLRYQESLTNRHPPFLLDPFLLSSRTRLRPSGNLTLTHPEDPLTCLRITSSLTRLSLSIILFFDATPSFGVQTEEDMLPADYLDFILFATNAGCEDILVPKLEVLKMYDMQQLIDETLLHVLISRVDAVQMGDVSPHRHVKLQIPRRKQKDIRKAVLERAKSAGFEMKVELQYAPDGPHKGRLCPSFLLTSTNFNSLPKIWPPDWE